MACGIYLITCKENNKKYVGSSNNICQRWNSHKSKLRNNRHTPILQNIHNKYGIDSLEFSILEECEIRIIIEREQYWYDYLKSLGNIMLNYSDIIENPTRGKPLSEDRKIHLSKIFKGKPNVNKGKKMPLSFCEKISNGLKGHKMTQKNKEILREYLIKPKSIEHKKKISDAKKKTIGVKVICIDTNEIFDSYTDVAEKYKTTYQNVRQSIIKDIKCKKMKFKLLKTNKND